MKLHANETLKNKRFMIRIFAVLLSAVLAISLLAGCSDTEDPADGSASPTKGPSSASDAPATSEYVAKVGDLFIYESDFYYFLYSGLREIYYNSEGIYDETLTEEENYQRMLDFFHSEKEDGTTYLDEAIERSLQIAAGFKVASALGRLAGQEDSKYAVDQDEIDNVNDYIDSEADYGASVYSSTRDEYFFYAYGMNVNDAKRYTEEQLFAEKHESWWADAFGYVLGVEKPKEPTEPKDPGEDASDSDKEKYEKALAEYKEALAEYESALEEYEAAAKIYWDKFRESYEESRKDYDIATLRYLYVSTLNEDGESLSEEEIAAKRAAAESYMGLVEQGFPFENIVRGFSDSETAVSDLGLIDLVLSMAEGSGFPEEAISWAAELTAPSDELRLFSDDTGFYIVQLVGITDFDGTDGIVAEPEYVNLDAVRANVEYVVLADLYNKFIEEQIESGAYAITEKNYEAMKKLAEDYLAYNADEFEAKAGY